MSIRIGIISFAHVHAHSYLQLLAAWPGVELLATDPHTPPGGRAANQAGDTSGEDGKPRVVGDPGGPGDTGDPEVTGEVRGAAFAAQFGVAYVPTLTDLFAWRPDAVIVLSENVHHREHVLLAAAHGVPVLCEKPLATTVVDAVAMRDACRAAGVWLMTAYPVRFSPMVTGLARLVREGALGQILSALGTNNGRIPVASRAWFTDPTRSGGGALVDHVVHVADVLDLVTGWRPTQVYAVANRVLHAEKPGVAVETGGLVTVVYDSGAHAVIDCSWSQPDAAPTWGGLTLQLVGSAGIATIDPFAQQVGGLSAATGTALSLPYGQNLDATLLTAFLEAVATGRAPEPDGDTGIRSLAIVCAAQESARTGTVVDVALP